MNEQVRNDIIARSLTGQSQREIASELHVSRNTVKAVMNQRQAARDGDVSRLDQRHKGPARGRILDRFEAEIRDSLLRYPGIKVVEIHRQLRAIGCEVSYTNLRLRVNQIKKSIATGKMDRVSAPGAVGRASCRPIALDLARNAARQAYLFQFQLMYSRDRHFHLAESDDLITVMFEHLIAFRYFCGVPAVMQYVGFSAAIGPTDGSEFDFNQVFLRFANHYGFRPLLADEPTEQRDELVDRLQQDCLHARKFRSLGHANDALSTWQSETNWETGSERNAKLTNRSREQQQLIPLPKHPWSG